MAVYAGRKDALTHLSKITDWAIENLDRSRKVDSDTEWYTLSENLYRAYVLTGDEKYRRFARRVAVHRLLERVLGARRRRRSRGTATTPTATSTRCRRARWRTRSPARSRTSTRSSTRYDWLQQTQCYATGGYGPDEDLVAPDGELGRRARDDAPPPSRRRADRWAGFKLSRYLLRFTGEARYGDWIERLLYNGIGAALPMGARGATFYYSDYRLGGGRKVYHLDGTWPCCSGTYPQSRRRLPQRRLLPRRRRPLRQPLRALAGGMEPGRHRGGRRAGDGVSRRRTRRRSRSVRARAPPST